MNEVIHTPSGPIPHDLICKDLRDLQIGSESASENAPSSVIVFEFKIRVRTEYIISCCIIIVQLE